MQANRLERAWRQIGPEILNRWPKLSEDDLAACDFKFDLIVEAVRRTYYPGRSHLTLEGSIRDWLVERLEFYESRTNQT